MRRVRAILRKALPPVLVLVMVPTVWTVREDFEAAGTDEALPGQWQEYRTFGDQANPWRVIEGTAERSSRDDEENSEVVALIDEAVPVSDQQVSITINELELRPTGAHSWASVGVLARGQAESAVDGRAEDLSAYNGELILTDQFGPLQYLLLIWRVKDWSFGDAPEDVAVLKVEPVGKSVTFPVRLTVRTSGDVITAFVVQANGKMTRGGVGPRNGGGGGGGMISSLIAPKSARISVDDFEVRGTPGG